MNNIYIEDRVLFFNYMESIGLNLTKHYILEESPSILESQSRLLVEKYKDKCKQFLVSANFDYDNSFNVKGVKGSVYLKSSDIKINSYVFLLDKSLYNIKALLEMRKELPRVNDFDILLIQGMPGILFNLYGARISKVFGDVLNKDDENYRDSKSLYEAIYRLIRESSPHEYELCHDSISELGKELYLIKRR